MYLSNKFWNYVLKKSVKTIALSLRIWLWPVCPFDIDDNHDNSDSDNDISDI